MSRRIIAIADDHELFARGTASLLAPHHEVGGVARSGRELLALLRHSSIECVLLDLSMPDQSGLEVLPELQREWPGLRTIVLTMHVDRTLANAALGLGAHGYVPKDAGLDELLLAIDEVCAGRRYVSPRIPKHTERTGLQARHPSLASLTPRQQRILLLLGKGMSSAAIAQEIGLTLSTITFHRANLRRKLGIDSKLGLHQLAVLVQSELSEDKALADPAAPAGPSPPGHIETA
jgi:DNA-binding NarL/FixJ family response regulator